MSIKSFTTQRLTLTPACIDDAAYFLELFNSPKWLHFIGDRNVHTLQEAENYISKKMLPQYERLGYGNYVVTLQSDGTKIGSCGLYDRSGLEGIDIGFAFLPQFEKKGYAFEAASAIRDAAFREFNLPFLSAITTKENEDSQRLLERLGLDFIKYFWMEGDPEELMLFKMENPSVPE